VNLKKFFAELKRRNVYRVVIAYAVVSWLLIQIATQVFPFFDIPNWAVRLVVLLLALGFPVALILAWALELTPDGVQLTKPAEEQQLPKRRVPRPLFWGLIAAGVVAGLGLTFHLFRTPAPPANAAAEPPSKRAVAVLPFENLSEDAANAYFADGMQDEIITRLAKIGELKVISRTSTLRYKSKPESIPDVARQLGVGHVVEGSVQRIADRVRINVQLIDAATDDHVWAELYDRHLADVFAVQTEVATAIAHSLRANLTRGERDAVARQPTTNLAAYDAYLRGVHHDSKPGQAEADQRKALEFFLEATRLDPNFALAWAEISRIRSGLNFVQQDSTAANRELARAAAETAARLDPDAPATLLAQAYYRYHVERDYEGARELFERLRSQMPSSSEAPAALARIARRQSRWRDCIRLFEEAAQLNPRDAALAMDRAWTFSMVRDHAATLRMAEQAEAISGGDPDVLANKAQFLQGMGDLAAARQVIERIPAGSFKLSVEATQLVFERRFREAAEVLERKVEAATSLQDRGMTLQWLGWVRWHAGDEEAAAKANTEAKQLLESLAREQPENIFVSMTLAMAEMALGNKDAALREARRGMAALPASRDPVFSPIAEESLAALEGYAGQHEQALERIERLLRTPYGAYPLTQAKLRLDPIWDPLRQHPRFKAIAEPPEPQTIY
jgi:TolB-like protein